LFRRVGEQFDVVVDGFFQCSAAIRQMHVWRVGKEEPLGLRFAAPVVTALFLPVQPEGAGWLGSLGIFDEDAISCVVGGVVVDNDDLEGTPV